MALMGGQIISQLNFRLFDSVLGSQSRLRENNTEEKASGNCGGWAVFYLFKPFRPRL